MSLASSPRRVTGPPAAVLAITLAVSGCGPEDPTTSTDVPPVVAELCRAQAEPAEAEERFANVHGSLHELADEVQHEDRPAAAALLEAKRAVEDTLAESEEDHDELADRLAPLVDAVRDALAALDRPAPPCDANPPSR